MNIMEIAMEKGLKQGIEQGKEQEKGRINFLNKILLEEDRLDDLRRSIEDEEYQRKLCEEYHI